MDAQRGYVPLRAAGTPPIVYRTDDGGLTWTASRPLPGSSGVPGVVRAFGAALLVEVRDSEVGQVRRSVYRSTDGGTSWMNVAILPATPTPGALGLASASRWLLLSVPGESQETTDSGATWHDYASEYQQAAPVDPAVVFADASVGYATVRGTIQRTTDGGAHWTSIKTPGTG